MGLGGEPAVILAAQLVIVILFATLTTYGREAQPKALRPKQSSLQSYYPMFQDIHVMIFIGFGFLMTFLKKYGFSSVGFNFFLSAIILQWGILCQGIFNKDFIQVGITSLIGADVMVAAVLISMGAVLGKTTPVQLLIMGVVETVLFTVVEEISSKFQITDVGDSIGVHAYGAYFGLAVSMVLGNPKNKHLEGSNYNSDLFAMIGTLFLWVFWPSFNGATCEGADQQRAVINTYLSISASCVVAFALSSLTNKEYKFNMVHIQNATLAGGVAIGTSANLMVHPYGALIIGSLGGLISTLGYVYLQPWLTKKIGLHDTCGVHNLHGMPGVFSGIAGAVVSALADKESYGYDLYLVFPARAPEAFTSEMQEFQQNRIEALAGISRSSGEQAGYQILALVITLAIAIVAGAITGFILKTMSKWTGHVKEEFFFNDCQHWDQEEDDKVSFEAAFSVVKHSTRPNQVHPIDSEQERENFNSTTLEII